MSDLSQLCLEDLDKLKRMKVETLVTIHVHQRDLFLKILEGAKSHTKIDGNDFEWTRNTRIYNKEDTYDIAV